MWEESRRRLRRSPTRFGGKAMLTIQCLDYRLPKELPSGHETRSATPKPSFGWRRSSKKKGALSQE
jgi:hypothetical protein